MADNNGQPQKRGRGRPKKDRPAEELKLKRPRGRPPKAQPAEIAAESVTATERVPTFAEALEAYVAELPPVSAAHGWYDVNLNACLAAYKSRQHLSVRDVYKVALTAGLPAEVTFKQFRSKLHSARTKRDKERSWSQPSHLVPGSAEEEALRKAIDQELDRAAE